MNSGSTGHAESRRSDGPLIADGAPGVCLVRSAACAFVLVLLAVLKPETADVSPTAGVATLSSSVLFERNDGQHDPAARFVARSDQSRVAFLADGVELSVDGPRAIDRVTMHFQGARLQSPRGERPSPSRAHYFIGRDPRAWRADVPTFERLRYPSAYPGVDLVFYGAGRQLEYDVVVAAGADPRLARVAFSGADRLRLDDDGNLAVAVAGSEIRYARPVAYQLGAAGRTSVDAAYRLDGSMLSFEVGAYDRSRELVIDPVLVFSTYLGGSGNDGVYDVTVDAAGASYVTGYTESSNFLATAGAAQPTKKQGADAFVRKYDRYGSLVYSTFFGGSEFDRGTAIAVDAAGAAYVMGMTGSADLPISPNALQTMPAGESDLFVMKLSASGSRVVYATYLGGSARDDFGGGDIAVDPLGVAYVVGTTESGDFPTTSGALQRTHTAGRQIGFAAKLNTAGSALVYSTLLTGTELQRANGIALDSLGRAVVGGFVFGSMTTTTTIGTTLADTDGYVLKLNAAGSALVYSTRFGGSGDDQVNGVALDTVDDSPHVVGVTSSPDFTPSGFHVPQTLKGVSDAFVMRLNPQGTARSYMTLIGGSGAEVGFAVDVSHHYVTVFGVTQSTDFPLQRELQSRSAGDNEIFITRLNYGFEPIFSTYLGGSKADAGLAGVVDGAGAMTVAGWTLSTDFPTSHAAQAMNRSLPTNLNESVLARAALVARGTPGPQDVVVHVADASTLHGNWQRVADSTAAGGERLHNPDAGLPKLTSALAAPVDYVEFTVDGLDNGPYMVWVRGKADNNAFANDSVFLQFSNARNVPDEADNERDIYKIGTTEGLAISIEDCTNCGLHGWGWQDGGYGRRVPGPWLYFTNGQPTTVRVQRREDGVSIDQIVIARQARGAEPYFYSAPGYQKDDDTILPAQNPVGGGTGDADLVMYPAVDGATLHGSWVAVADASAAGGTRLSNPDAGTPKLASALAAPRHYFDLTFTARAGLAYRLWIRGRADNDYWGSDSAYVQFSGSVTGLGAPTWRIGTTSATTYITEDCSGCGLEAWGWNDNAYGVNALGPLVYFAADGPQTIRVQSREDGLSVDQIVLSPARYLNTAPGATKHDSTIVSR
jgi:hypothetical protein